MIDVRPANSAMSAPAMKALSPAPVKTTTPTELSARSSSSNAAPSSRVLILSAFLLSGRLMVIMATRSRFSSSKVSYVSGIYNSSLLMNRILFGGRGFGIRGRRLLVSDPRHEKSQPAFGGFRYLHSHSCSPVSPAQLGPPS